MLRGWCFPSLAWLVILNVGLCFVLVYGLAATDHHMAERIPQHLHQVAAGTTVPQHVHTFGQSHVHRHSGSPVANLTTSPLLSQAAPILAIETWRADLLVAHRADAIYAGQPLNHQPNIVRTLRDQIRARPPTPPPTDLPANTR